jgi:hypothetical protein
MPILKIERILSCSSEDPVSVNFLINCYILGTSHLTKLLIMTYSDILTESSSGKPHQHRQKDVEM